jgi:hypothetical protein
MTLWAFRLRASVAAVGLVATASGVLAFASQDDPDDEARLNAKVALSSARVVYLEKKSYTDVTLAFLKKEHPELQFVEDTASGKFTIVSLKVLAPDHLRLAVYGRNTCWGAREKGMPGGEVGTDYAKRQGPAKECTATSFKDAEFAEHQRVWPR